MMKDLNSRRDDDQIEVEEVSICETRQEKLDETAIDALSRKRANAILQGMKSQVIYAVDDRPPLPSSFLLAVQQFFVMFGSALTMPRIVGTYVCIASELDLLSKLVATNFFMSGLQTFLQVTIGVRLPIIQGPSPVYFIPIIAMSNIRGECPVVGDTVANTTITHEDVEIEFRSRIQEISGAVLIASLIEFLIGCSGILFFLMKYIGPLTIAPTIGVLGIYLFNFSIQFSSGHWGIAILSLFMMILFSQYLERFAVPCIGYTKTKRCHVTKFNIFRFFPIFLAISMAWLFCFILTETNVFPSDPAVKGYKARTDILTDQIGNTTWFYLPYPGQWGAPVISVTGAVGMTIAAIASTVESIGDYYALAKISGAPPPPAHAVNRGIGMEGLGGIFAALWGAGVSSTSYTGNIGVIGLTKVSSLFVLQMFSLIALFMGVFSRLQAVFATIPFPVIGGVLTVLFGMVAAVGISSLQYVDMNSPRNILIVGFSFFMGIAVPGYARQHPDLIRTGSVLADQVLYILLTSNTLLGGGTGFILDNTIPGSREMRGITFSREATASNPTSDATERNPDEQHGHTLDPSQEADVRDRVSQYVNKSYDMPLGMAYIRRWSWTKKIPVSPTFRGFHVFQRKKGKTDRHDLSTSDI